jgi:hypothetical protein
MDEHKTPTFWRLYEDFIGLLDVINKFVYDPRTLWVLWWIINIIYELLCIVARVVVLLATHATQGIHSIWEECHQTVNDAAIGPDIVTNANDTEHLPVDSIIPDLVARIIIEVEAETQATAETLKPKRRGRNGGRIPNTRSRTHPNREMKSTIVP